MKKQKTDSSCKYPSSTRVNTDPITERELDSYMRGEKDSKRNGWMALKRFLKDCGPV